MVPWLAFGLLAGAFPEQALHQPRPSVVRPVPSGVVPADHAGHALAPAFSIPPAPLASQSAGESSVSEPESCFDSNLQPPAPPAEWDVAEFEETDLFLDGRKYRLRSFVIQPTAACDEPFLDVEAAPHLDVAPPGNRPTADPAPLAPTRLFPDAVPALPLFPRFAESWSSEPARERPPAALTREQLEHMRAAIEHLDAAGLADAADELRGRLRKSEQELRQQRRRQLETKEAEVKRLSQEIEQLKRELQDLDGVQPANLVPSEITPLSNEEVSAQPSLKLINPKFYVGDAPPQVLDRWRRAFAPAPSAPGVLYLRPHQPRLNAPPSSTLPPAPLPVEAPKPEA